MKKASEIMQELGFNKDAPVSSQEAFIKHLIKAATGKNISTPSEKKNLETQMAAAPEKIISFPQQMSFDFADVDLELEQLKNKKISS